MRSIDIFPTILIPKTTRYNSPMTPNPTVAVLGTGNIGAALISGLLEAKALLPENLIASDVSEQQLNSLAGKHNIRAAKDNREAAETADVIVLAVKPYLIGDVLQGIREILRPEQILISVAAGVPIEFIEHSLITTMPIIRAMPNIAMTVHASATALCGNAEANAEHRAIAEHIFKAVGTVAWVNEDKMHAVTGLSGSGPAYVYLILEGLTAGGLNMGLPLDVARALAQQTLLGAAKLAQQTGEHPAQLKDKVTTPGGTTIAGLAELERHNVRAALMQAVQAATERSQELSRKLK